MMFVYNYHEISFCVNQCKKYLKLIEILNVAFLRRPIVYVYYDIKTKSDIQQYIKYI